MENPSNSNLLQVDDFYFSALIDEEENFPVSDEKYAEELQLQEVLMSLVLFPQKIKTSEVFCSQMTIGLSTTLEEAAPMRCLKQVAEEGGESSQHLCEICMEGKSANEMFKLTTCSHIYCTDCTSKYIATKIQENVNIVRCPEFNCEGVIDIDLCRWFIPNEVFDRWATALCDSLLIGFQKFYCPYKDCSEMFVDEGEEVIRESECPICWRLFCAQCKVPWHSGLECQDFQLLNEDDRKKEDLKVVELAKNQKWRRCPQCKFFVEKGEGCLHITCRCGFEFCYRCGSEYTQTHGNCPEL